MKNIFLFVLLFSTQAYSTEPENYSGTWKSERFGLSGSMVIELIEEDGFIKANYRVIGSPVFDTGSMNGQRHQEKNDTKLVFKGDDIDLEVDKTNKILKGHYKCKKMLCFGDHGEILLEQKVILR